MNNSAKLLQKFLMETPLMIDNATKQFNDLGVGFSEEGMESCQY